MKEQIHMILQQPIEQKQDKFSSIQQRINIPQIRHLNHETEKIFKIDESFAVEHGININNIPDAIRKSRDQLVTNLEQKCVIYDDVYYKFQFPESKFPDVPQGQKNQISYEQKVHIQEQDTFRDRLSQEQIKQIAQKGQFEVRSSNQLVKIPYVWRINGNIFVGQKKRINIWENGISGIFQHISEGVQILFQQIPIQLKNLVYLPAKFFSLIVGRRKLTSIYTPNYHKQICKDFWTDIMENDLKQQKQIIGGKLFQYLYVPYQAKYSTNLQDKLVTQNQKTQYFQKQNQLNKKYEKLKEVQNKFDHNWMKIRKRVLQRVSSSVETNENAQAIQASQEDILAPNSFNSSDEQILKNFRQQKFAIYKAHIKQHLPKQGLGLQIIESIIQIITIISIIEGLIKLKDQKLSQISSKIRNKIKKEHSIRGRVYRYVDRKLNKEFKPIKDKIQEDFYHSLTNDQKLAPWLTDNYRNIMQKYITFKKNYQQLLINKKKELKIIYIPSRVFRTTYMLLPPYQVSYDGSGYTCKKRQEMTIDTSSDFWKFKLYAMRMKSWTINCLVALIAFAWVGPLGMRCLFGTQEFKYDENCDWKTGQKYYSRRKTFLGVFLTVLQGIKKSREHFQSQPDRGLFGKNFSRYFSYIQCYIFRLLFVGIIGVLIIYPILIVVLSLISIALIVTFWIWVPIIMIVCYLFNIFVFQFETSFIGHGILIRSIPLISLVLYIARCILIIIGIALYAFILAPIFSGIYFLFLIIQRVFRTLVDKLMLFLFKKIGRTPSKDTIIARKISGPGMSRGYFLTVHQEDVYVLTQGHLENIYLNKFAELTRRKIKIIQQQYKQLIKFVLLPFGHNQPTYSPDVYNYLYNKLSIENIIGKNIRDLLGTFEKQLQNHRNRYPRNPKKVRFTQQQIDQYFENSIKIVKNFVQKQQIQNWIFDQNHLIHQDYQQLTRLVWSSIFGCGQQIFQPVQQIDSRLTIEDLNTTNSSKMKKNVGSVMKALEGEIRLNRDRVSFTPAKHSLLTKDIRIGFLHEIAIHHQQNTLREIGVGLQFPQTILFPHQNLQELKKYDEYCRNNIKKRYNKIIEE